MSFIFRVIIVKMFIIIMVIKKKTIKFSSLVKLFLMNVKNIINSQEASMKKARIIDIISTIHILYSIFKSLFIITGLIPIWLFKNI